MIRTSVFAFAAAMLGLAPSALAQDKGTQTTEKPCMADAARLCPGVEPGGGNQVACLKAHKDELSPACKKKIVEKKEQKEQQQQQQQQPQQQKGEQPAPQPQQ